MKDNSTQLAIIGGGPGGYAAAFLAADLGMTVTLIDPQDSPGGVCLYRGCIPSKALLHVAKLINETRAAGAWGLHFPQPRIELDKMRAWKEGVVGQLTLGLGQLVKQRKVEHIQATAIFQDAHTLKVTNAMGSHSSLRFEHAIIATGSRAARIPALDIDCERIWYSKEALALPQVPKRLLVIGGGYIGLELTTVYAALGSEVTVVEMTPTLLPGVDRELVRFLGKGIKPMVKEILLETTASDPKVDEHGIEISFNRADDKSFKRTFDTVLVAVGRRPVSTGLGLKNTAVQVDDKGFIQIDGQCRAAAPNIFAVGDVTGEPMLAHKASQQAQVAVEVIAGRRVAYEPAAVPAVVFTDPEVAWAGLGEAQAKAQGIDYSVARFPWAASGRAVTMGRGEGLTKLIIEAGTERIIGAAIVGPGAGEMIAEAVVAIEMAANVTDLSLCIHPHPTLSETLKEAAELFHGRATHLYRPLRKPKGASK